MPTKQQEHLKPALKALFYQKDRQAADQAVAAFVAKYRSVYPTAIECLQRDLEACLTFYAYPKTHWKTIRTNNIIERLFGEVKRRSHKMAAAFRKRSELCITVLCGHPEFALQQTHDACFIHQATRRRDFTQQLTNYQ